MIDEGVRSYELNQFAILEVVNTTAIGAFLEWGQPKDLFLHNSEQLWPVHVGDFVVVFIYKDHEERPCGTMRLDKHFKDKPSASSYEHNQKVELIIYDKTELGFKAVINRLHHGLIFHNEVFHSLKYGDQVDGYINRVRDDGKIDLLLSPTGTHGNEEISGAILRLLQINGGFYNLTDKTDPDIIYRLFGVSKKKFKLAVSHLYKERKVRVTDYGIYLVTPMGNKN